MAEPEFITWEDWPSQATPLNAATLNKATAGFSTALSESRAAQAAAASSATAASAAKTSVEASLANISGTIDGLVDTKIASSVPPLVAPAARAVKYGSPTADSRLARLQDAVMNPGAKDTRVVVLGSSTANGGNTPYREQGWHWRLAYRAGAQAVPDLPDAAIAAQNGLRWYNGALGGTNASNYAPAAKLTQVNSYVKPNYVFHMVGSNDWRSGTPLASYKASVKSVLTSIEAANPGVVNILVHQQERSDWTASIPWASYGQQLADLAAEKPASRIFINANDYFHPYDLAAGGNRFGLVSTDQMHMGPMGHLYMANVIGSTLGIPSESDFGNTSDFYPVPLPASTTYQAGTTLLASRQIPAAAFPRLVRLHGSVYMRSSANTCELQTTLYNALTGGSSIGALSFQVVSVASGGVSQAVPTAFYLPPRVSARVEIAAGVPAGQTLYISGSAIYSTLGVYLEAI